MMSQFSKIQTIVLVKIINIKNIRIAFLNKYFNNIINKKYFNKILYKINKILLQDQNKIKITK